LEDKDGSELDPIATKMSKIFVQFTVDVIREWLILLLIIMGTISGCKSYYALEEFGARHCEALCKMLGLNLNRFPSDTTFRRVLQKLDFALLAQQFEQWTKEQVGLELGEEIAIDGKSIKSTVDKEQSGYQNFVNMVSVYSQRQGVVLAVQAFESKSTSELKVVQKLLKALALQDVVVTLDALHCQKNNAVSC
jgi:hypothetical protein